MRATARAHPNFALSKYWGKRSVDQNIPAVPSLSLTVAGLRTTTSVETQSTRSDDELVLGGRPASPAQARRVSTLLDTLWPERRRPAMRVRSDNDFPTAAGLASSAAAFAALAVAANEAGRCGRSVEELSDLARRASASAGRSLYGGFAELPAGSPHVEPGATCPARSIAGPDHWALRVVIAVTAEGPKATGSTEGMIRTAATSPFYPSWLTAAEAIHERVLRAVLDRNFGALAEAAEHSALTMHAVALAATPPLLYWNAGTMAMVDEVSRMRADGLQAFFTIDAGPHVKVFTTESACEEVERRVRRTQGVLRTILARPGPGAHVVDPEPGVGP